MKSSDVLQLYSDCNAAGIEIWIDGGWCVDALLNKQLRPHKDLDIAIQWEDVPKLRELLATKGYTQSKEESQWNFVLIDNSEHEIDVHAFVYDVKGNIVEGIMYPAESLAGEGIIDDHTVRCISPKYMVGFLAPWIHKWPEKYLEAVSALCEKYGIDLPTEYLQFKKTL